MGSHDIPKAESNSNGDSASGITNLRRGKAAFLGKTYAGAGEGVLRFSFEFSLPFSDLVGNK